jgi:hypothetical protein
VELALGRALGLGKAVPKVGSAESSNPPPGAAFTVLAEEDSGVGLAMVPRFNSPNNTKLRVRTLSSGTHKQALRAVLSTLTNAANNTGSKRLPTSLSCPSFYFSPVQFFPFLYVSLFLACCSSQFLGFSYCPVDRRRFLLQL